MIRIYENIAFPNLQNGKPHVFCNMVATIDGKILSGSRDENVMDLGSKVDHQALRDLESHADAVLIGAQTLRSTKGIWYSNHLYKAVLSNSGNVPLESRFFSDMPERAIVFSSAEARKNFPEGSHWLKTPTHDSAEFVLQVLSSQFGVKRLLIEGGSELNATFFAAGLIDEIFLTIAPKIKLGRETPTIAGGEPLTRNALLNYKLIQNEAVGDELFLRYRRDSL